MHAYKPTFEYIFLTGVAAINSINGVISYHHDANL